jgi:hypothetical protein
LAHDKVAQGIEAEFAKRSEANWSGKPDPRSGMRPKTKKANQTSNQTSPTAAWTSPLPDLTARTKTRPQLRMPIAFAGPDGTD